MPALKINRVQTPPAEESRCISERLSAVWTHLSKWLDTSLRFEAEKIFWLSWSPSCWRLIFYLRLNLFLGHVITEVTEYLFVDGFTTLWVVMGRPISIAAMAQPEMAPGNLSILRVNLPCCRGTIVPTRVLRIKIQELRRPPQNVHISTWVCRVHLLCVTIHLRTTEHMS